MHPQVIGRWHRMALLERFIEHALPRGAAQFARMGDVAREMSEKKESNSQSGHLARGKACNSNG